MSSDKGKNERLLTRAIIVISVAGILYFGYQAILDNSKKDRDNPFEYNISNFKKSDSGLVHYSEVRHIDIELNELFGIAIGADNKIYVSGDNSVLILNSGGNIQTTIAAGQPVRCLTVDGEGDIYLGMADHIEIYNQKGIKKAQWEFLGEDAIVTSIAVSKEAVFIADAGNHVVWKYDKTGALLSRIGDRNEAKDIPGFIIPSPYFDVGIDPDGFFWVVNPGRHSLENYNSDGGIRSSWGYYSMEMEGFCGCCNPSHFVIMEDGSFVTSEKGIARVKILNRIGRLVSIVAGAEQFDEGTVGLDLALDSEQRIFVLDPKRRSVRVFEKKRKN